MNSFYIILIAFITAGAATGCLLGGIRILVAALKISVTAAALYFLFQPFTEWLTGYCMVELVYACAVSLSAILLTSFVAMELLTRSIIKNGSLLHKNIFNRIAGAATGIAASAVACLFFLHYYSTVAMPDSLQDELKQTGIVDAFDERIKLVRDRLVFLAEEQPVQVMAVKAIDPVKEDFIQLSFSTTNYTVRPELETEMLQLVNRERTRQGLLSLSFDTALMKAARLHSADMLRRGYFSHHTPEGTDPFQRLRKLNIHYRYAGENLALAPTLLQAHDGLMRSPGHKANIMHPSYGRMGIGIIDAGIYGLMVTQEFRD